jgi:U3 small nucleolar RNA-associated protein MPP10
MAKKSKKASADVAVLDFGNMKESEGGGKRYPEGDYVGKILKASRDVSSDKGSPCIKLNIAITYPEKYKGKKLVERLWLSPKSLERVYDLLTTLGMKVPKTEVQLPLKKLKGKEIGFTLVDEEYENRLRSRLGWDFLDPEDVISGDDDDEDEDLEEGLDDEDEDEDEEEEEDEDEEDLEGMDRAELKAYIKENDLDVKVKKSMDEDDIREAIGEAEEDDDEDDDDDDELEELDLDEL